jgi:hypothetical protein
MSVADAWRWHIPPTPTNAELSHHKRCARMDLAFSSTVPVAPVGWDGAEGTLLHACEIDDLLGDTAPRQVMTDGCGFASPDVLRLAREALVQRGGGDDVVVLPQVPPQLLSPAGPCMPPSAVQFRLGGYKGVLCVNPFLPPRSVCLRPSQRKIDVPPRAATHTQRELEAMRCSRDSGPARPSRQVLLLLQGLGVPLRTLRALQLEAAGRLLDAQRRCARGVF